MVLRNVGNAGRERSDPNKTSRAPGKSCRAYGYQLVKRACSSVCARVQRWPARRLPEARGLLAVLLDAGGAQPGEAVLETIQTQFADILAEGRFEICGQLPEEKEETSLAALPRMVFQYNRYNQGRLRQLIDFLNRIPEGELGE